MRVIWLELAQDALYETAQYLRENFGETLVDKLMDGVSQYNVLLEDNPYMGKVEPYLEDKTFEYRSIVMLKYNKIVYRVDDTNIVVVDFWNCRRSPEKQAARIVE